MRTSGEVYADYMIISLRQTHAISDEVEKLLRIGLPLRFLLLDILNEDKNNGYIQLQLNRVNEFMNNILSFCPSIIASTFGKKLQFDENGGLALIKLIS